MEIVVLVSWARAMAAVKTHSSKMTRWILIPTSPFEAATSAESNLRRLQTQARWRDEYAVAVLPGAAGAVGGRRMTSAYPGSADEANLLRIKRRPLYWAVQPKKK